MTFTYKNIARLTSDIELAMAVLDETLRKSLSSMIHWRYRDISTTKTLESNYKEDRFMYYFEQEKRIRIQGSVFGFSSVNAVIVFTGHVHEGDNLDCSKPLEVNEIQIEVVHSDGEKSYFVFSAAYCTYDNKYKYLLTHHG